MPALKPVLRKVGLGASAFSLVVVAVVGSRPAALPTEDLKASLANSSSSSSASNAQYLYLNPNHYGLTAASAGADSGEGDDEEEGGCDEFSVVGSGPLYDGWVFVTRAETNVSTFQVAFRDSSVSPAALRIYKIVSNGSTVTSTPAAGGAISFSKTYSHIAVLTPNPGKYALLSKTDSALPSGTSAPTKIIYSKTVNGTDPSTTTSYFNLSHTCPNKRLTTSTHSGCQYPADESVITVPSSFTGSSLKGKLTCHGVPQPGEEVDGEDEHGHHYQGTTNDDGSFEIPGWTGGSYSTVVRCHGSSSVPPAPGVTSKHS